MTVPYYWPGLQKSLTKKLENMGFFIDLLLILFTFFHYYCIPNFCIVLTTQFGYRP